MGTHPVLRSFSAIGRGEINKNMFELQDDDYIEKRINCRRNLEPIIKIILNPVVVEPVKGIFLLIMMEAFMVVLHYENMDIKLEK